jgi:hypothetical protein
LLGSWVAHEPCCEDTENINKRGEKVHNVMSRSVSRGG